ncbi:type VI secretion system tip protein VgrG [Aquiflexum lacus]|uniref:type VI secretion system tip protein VgrG n=1 Tax=Aquiflexum lacus TaxID=2483805 RepID=UPI001894B90B|nr:type VI secretion system tip protein VgrG [Aquiflexum lacus]
MPIVPVSRTIPTQSNPTLATFKIFSEGEQLPDSIGVSLVAVTKNINKISSARLVIHDGDLAEEDFFLSSGNMFLPGKEIEIKAGYNNLEDTIFKGIIIRHGLEYKADQASKLVLELKDKAIKMTVGRKNKYFFETTDSDIIEELIGSYGIDAEVEGTNTNHAEMVQYFISDWDFLVSRAEVNGMLVFNDDGKITVKKPDFSIESQLNLVFGDNVLEFDGQIDARDQFSNVTGKTWNFINQEVNEKESEEPGFEEPGNISGRDLADVIGLAGFPLQHTGHITDDELQNWSDAKLLRSRLSKIQGRLKIIGFADIKPGSLINLGGFGTRFNGKCYVSGVYHEMSTEIKWYTYLDIGLSQKTLFEQYDDVLDIPASGLVAPIRGLHQGIVTTIQDDPDGEGRVKVKIPLISLDEEGIWARLSTLDAGEGERGTFFYPEVGDEVIVGFFNEDPRDPVILGKMHSSSKPTPLEPQDDNFQKGIFTKGKSKLVFDDEVKSITLETESENKIIISEEKGGVSIEDENGNKITLNSDGISLESAKDIILKASGDIKIEGMNVSAKADAEFKGEGGGGAELSSSAMTVVKGSLVQIN